MISKVSLKTCFAVAILCVGSASTGFAQSNHLEDHYNRWGRANPDAFEWSGMAIGIHGGSLGFGAEGTLHITDWLNARVNAHYASVLVSTTIDEIDYDFDYSALGLLLSLDLYPGPKGNFRLVAGLGLRDADIAITGIPRIAGAAELGHIRGVASYDTIAPYVGFGFGNAVLPDKRLSMSIDFGVLFQGYNLRLSPEGPLAEFVPDEALQEIESDVRERLDWLKMYPVIQVGVSYHF